MAFISLPPDVVYTVDDLHTLPPSRTLILPQHQELTFDDPNEGFHQRCTIYTGTIYVREFNAGGSHKDLIFQYPILGTFKNSFGAATPGIMRIGDPAQFRSAVADAAVVSGEFGSNPVWADVTLVSADLIGITLDSGEKLNAVVLSGQLTARNARLTAINYRVTVLDRLNENPKVKPPILIGDGGWTGNYTLLPDGRLGGMVNGIPQDKLDLL
jgi:hypothetical protein